MGTRRASVYEYTTGTEDDAAACTHSRSKTSAAASSVYHGSAACTSMNEETLKPTVHSEKDEHWLWRAPVFGDFVVHGAVPLDSKLEKGSKKAPQLGFEPQMHCYASGVNGLDFHGLYPIQCFGGKTWPKSYSCYGLLFGEIDFKNTIGRAFHGGLPKKL